MNNAQNRFREYIHWRSRMVVYVAIALMVFALVGLAVLISSSAINVARFGLVLQLLGTLAFVPDVVGKERVRRWSRGLAPGQEPFIPETGGNPAQGSPAGQTVTVSPVMDGEAFFLYYQKHNLPVLLGNLIASIGFIWMLVAYILNIQAIQFPEEQLLWAMLCVLGFAWIDFYLLINVFRLNDSTIPPSVLACFFAIDMLTGILGVVFAGMIHILLRWFSRGMIFLLDNGARQVLMVITLPCFIVGLAFELLATFL